METAQPASKKAKVTNMVEILCGSGKGSEDHYCVTHKKYGKPVHFHDEMLRIISYKIDKTGLREDISWFRNVE